MTYSLRRRRRSARIAPGLRRWLVAGLCLAALGVALYGFLSVWRASPDPEAARTHLERSLAALEAHNPTVARQQAVLAVRADPGRGEAHALLARTQLMLDDGLAAEAELRRAIDAGLDAGKLNAMMAHALLLQGDPERALTEVEKPSDPATRPYGLRVRARALTALDNLAGAREALDEALRIAPNDPGVWTDLGRFRLTAGDLVGAIGASERAVKLDGGDIDALVLRGELVRHQYGLAAALPWFEAALKRDSYYHDALIEYAATLGELGRTNEMLAVTRRALDARPASPQAFYLQAVLAARAGNAGLARDLLERTGGRIADLPGVLLLGGILDLGSGNAAQAVEKLQQLVGMQPMNIAARKLLALALLRSDAARNAIMVLRPVVARGDADSYAFALVGRGFERIEDREQAGRFLDRAQFPGRLDAAAFSTDDSLPVLGAEAAGRAPGDPATAVPLIRAMLVSGDRGGALARAQRVAQDNPGAPGAQLVLGDVLMLQDRVGEAAEAYRRASAIRFDEPAMLRLVEALDRLGRRAEAANALALFLSQNPRNVAGLRLAAHWQLVAGDFEGAAASLEDLRARLGDRDASIRAGLALAYAGLDKADAAIENGAAAYALAPANPAAVDAYGWALRQSGDAEGALELLTKAVRLAPRHPMLRWHLAQVLADLGRRPEAAAQARLALADPGFAERAPAQALIAEMG